MNVRFSTLNGWLGGRFPLPKILYLQEGKNDELEGYIALDICIPLYRALDISFQSLSISWEECNKYIIQSLQVIESDFDVVLDSEEAFFIKEKLGEPPSCCYPIYIITVGKGENERIVYVGKTSSKVSRFKGGHKAALKLHHPMYEGLEKNIYLSTIVFLNPRDKNYVPLEWIHPKNKALDILDSVESQLIYKFQPELNIAKRNKNYSKYNMSFHIQNFTQSSTFLNDKFIGVE